MNTPPGEHPFAPFVRILGKGKTGTRSLDHDEATQAFGMILRGEVEPLQLGAFLMLLRVKEETPEELAGFVAACRDYIGTPPVAGIDLDWSSYAGKRRHPPWFLLSALLLSENGVRILMHGSDGHTPGRTYTEATLASLGIPPAGSLGDAAASLGGQGFAYLPLRSFCQPLHDIVQLKPVLGLRSPVNTLARMLNPLRAPYSIQSVFHPGYAPLHTGADRLLGQPNSLVYKGDGGEVEIKPQATTRCHLLRGDGVAEFDWPRQLHCRPDAADAADTEAMTGLWSGKAPNNYGELATLETAATALFLLERAPSIATARALAQKWWQARNRERFRC